MFSSEQWLANSGGDFYNGVATQSLRFNQADNANLNFDPSGTSNQKTWVCSAWVKKTANGTTSAGGSDRYVFNTFTAGNNANCAVMGFRNDKPFYSTYGVEVLVATQVCRDTSAWYHLVWALDTTQATATNRLQIYINGSKITSFSVDARSNSYLNQNNDLAINNGNEVRVGNSGASSSPSAPFDGYLAEVNFIDGQSFFSDTSGTANSSFNINSFGETKNGVWIPIDTSGLTFGTNGFRLQFAQVGVGTASTSTIGADTSGNTHHFTSSGIVVSDCAMPDSPENNFATWNAVYRIYGDTGFTAPTNGGLFTRGGGDVNSDRGWGMSTIAINEVLRNSDGAGVYMEVRSPSVGGDNGYIGLFGRQGGDMKADGAVSRSDNTGYSHHHLISPNGRTLLEGGQSSSAALAGLNGAPTNNAVIGFAVKSDGKFFISVDGTFSTNADGNTQNPVTGANPMGTIDTDIDFFLHAGNISVFQANFGQDSTFGGNETATTNADANGIGAFHTAPPTGYLALCSANMAEPTISPNSTSQADDYFNTVLYTGNSTNNHAITGVGFKPDWVWIKKRNEASSHFVVDSSRGLANEDDGNGNARQLATNATYAEGDTGNNTGDGGMASFDSDGFTLGKGSYDANADSAYQRNNSNNDTFVAWNWLANGGTTSSNSDGSITSTVQANTDCRL